MEMGLWPNQQNSWIYLFHQEMSDINKKTSSRLRIKQMQSILFRKRPFRDIRKVRKRQHQYPEFGHTQGETFFKSAKKHLSIQGQGETQKTINFDGS
jgi:hypothetical protein